MRNALQILRTVTRFIYHGLSGTWALSIFLHSRMNTVFHRLFLFPSSVEMYGEVPTVSCRREFVSVVVSEKYCVEESQNFQQLLFTLCNFSGVINK
jgi:hypothetical protein